MRNTFRCIDCKEPKPVKRDGGTGYATTPRGKVCYLCCAVRDAKEMTQKGRIVLYLTVNPAGHKQVTNWPGTLILPINAYRAGQHNIAGSRTDIWFQGPDGKPWHGVQYGEWSQILRCKRLKSA